MHPTALDNSRRSELIRRYDRPGPRYTSYPTALQFSETDNSRLLADVRSGSGPLSLYIHLPFCESLCWFCACTTVITRDHNKADTYLDALAKEIDLFLPNLSPGRPVEQVHLGGGSPSFLEPAQLEKLGEILHSRFKFTANPECSVELDPRTLSEEKTRILARFGFTRASFGVQDVDPAVQQAVHRIQPDALNRKAIRWIRDAGFQSLNIDLIYGLPRQTVDSFSRTLDTALEYQPDRFAVFSYAHVPWVAPAQKILERDQLPDADTKLSMLNLTIEKLTAAGYVYIGMDHFARESDSLVQALRNGNLHRNFQGYSTLSGRELCGFGMSAISQSQNAYRQNYKDISAYYKAIAENTLPIERGYWLTEDDHIRRHVIMAIMCAGEMNPAAIDAQLNIDSRQYFARELSQLDNFYQDNLIEHAFDGGFRITENGRMLLRNIAMRFDAHFSQKEKRHARTI